LISRVRRAACFTLKLGPLASPLAAKLFEDFFLKLVEKFLIFFLNFVESLLHAAATTLYLGVDRICGIERSHSTVCGNSLGN
jgi:hypothetical protein